jgi:hypothetical protein
MTETKDQTARLIAQELAGIKSRDPLTTDEDCIDFVWAAAPDCFAEAIEAAGLSDHPKAQAKIQALAAAMRRHKPAYFYLVSSTENEKPVWKWGITTKATAKARSSAYVDTHRWVDIPSMAVGRRMEKLMGCLMVNVLNDRKGRDMYDESVPQSFPFEVLIEMIDWVIESVDNRGHWSPIGDALYSAACPGLVGLADAAPKFALEFRAKMEEAMRPVQLKELQPMWA